MLWEVKEFLSGLSITLLGIARGAFAGLAIAFNAPIAGTPLCSRRSLSDYGKKSDTS